MKKLHLLSLFLPCCFPVFAQDVATIRETVQELKTYPYSDPNPIPAPEALYYPYFRFDG